MPPGMIAGMTLIGVATAYVSVRTLLKYWVTEIAFPEPALFKLYEITTTLFGIAGVSVIGALGLFLLRRQFRVRLGDELRRDELDREEQTIERALDQFRSMLCARSRELLVDTEIAHRTGSRDPQQSFLSNFTSH